MRTVKKRHRDALRALRFSRSALKLSFIFGVVVFIAMALRIVVLEFPEMGFPYAELVRNIIFVTSGIYALFLFGSVVVVAFIYYLFKKNDVSTRIFKVRDLVLFLAIEIIVLAATGYITYSITAAE